MEYRIIVPEKSIPVRTIPELKEGERCITVGTIIKRQELRPSVLKQLCDEVIIFSSSKSVLFILVSFLFSSEKPYKLSATAGMYRTMIR